LPRSAAPVATLGAVGALAAAAWAAVDPDRGPLAIPLVAVAVVVAGFAWFESGTDAAKDVTLVATLGGLAAASRVLFVAVPNVQPVTVIAAASGAALGPRRGFAVGALAALASNVFLGQGAHTPWQMLGWGLCGVLGGLARPLVRRRVPFAAFCFALGFVYGIPLDLYTWLYLPHNEGALAAVLARGFPFNLAHALGNLALALVAGPELRRVLERYERRVRTEVVWA
jgi:energy-coupling factor transport system substrate-specific component